MSIRYHGHLDRGALSQALVAVALFGTTAVAIKATAAGPWTVGFVRLALAVAVFPVVFRFGREDWRLMATRWRLLLAMGVCFSLHWITYFFSIKLSSVGLASIGVASYGVHLLWLSCLLGRVRPKPVDFLCLGLVLAGVWLVAPHSTKGGGAQQMLGFAIGLVSGLLWATLPIFNQRAAELPAKLRSFPQYAVGFVLFLPFAINQPWLWSVKDWSLLLYLAVMCTLVAHTLWVKTSAILPGAATALIYYLHVPVALLLSWLLLGERIAPIQAAGIALIAIGSWMGIRAARQVVAKPVAESEP